MSPCESKIALEAGEIVKTSLPLGVPERERPRLTVVPFTDILDGVAEESVATPPDIDRVKSAASKAPDPELVSKTDSLKVTETIELFEAIDVDVISGGLLVNAS